MSLSFLLVSLLVVIGVSMLIKLACTEIWHLIAIENGSLFKCKIHILFFITKYPILVTGPSHLINQSQLNNMGQLSDTQTSATERGRQYVDLILAN